MKLPRMPSFRLDGRRALVSGASSGIGLGAAVALADAGAHVICAARNPEKLKDAVDAITAQGGRAEALVLDITDTVATAKAFAGLGDLDVFVNSTGLARHATALDTREEDFDAVAAINWKAAHFSAREAARLMIANNHGGSIITISSQMGHVGGIDRTVYAASKHAVAIAPSAPARETGGATSWMPKRHVPEAARGDSHLSALFDRVEALLGTPTLSEEAPFLPPVPELRVRLPGLGR